MGAEGRRRSPARRAIPAALILALLTALPATPAAHALTRAERTHWEIPTPWGAGFQQQTVGAVSVPQPRAAITVPTGRSSVYAFRSLHWRNWGKRVAVGQGRARYCDGGCTPWKAVRLYLSRPIGRDGSTCFDRQTPAANQYFYSLFRAEGLVYDSGARHQASLSC